MRSCGRRKKAHSDKEAEITCLRKEVKDPILKGWEVSVGEGSVTRILSDMKKTVIVRIVKSVKVRSMVKWSTVPHVKGIKFNL